MTSPPNDVDLLAAIQTAARRKDQSHQELDQAITAALDSGLTTTQIARVAGVSRQTIYRMRKETNE